MQGTRRDELLKYFLTIAYFLTQSSARIRIIFLNGAQTEFLDTYEKIRANLNACQFFGGTPMLNALQSSYTETDVKHRFVFTDGKPAYFLNNKYTDETDEI